MVFNPLKVHTSVVKKSVAAICPQWAWRKAFHDEGRSGAGLMPFAFRTLAIVVEATV